ncbi:adenylosuccinate synthase [Streptomyces sp. DH37]|uniref:adenylosuccinate synthase n=1 Tax=Streptomyces sp. DH37 TaxID=3040122 RepID=UPI002442661A|nr:adenylosuccinate synthase [Streptomyces sp. DH37]MDG9701980.1 adenylosuccinate synthase [Streptomyces sp. DH37]
MDLIIVGCQAGDEGKGKFTDIASEAAHAVVRYQAGPNTGHTVVVDGRDHRFVQVPAGVLRGAVGVLGNGCVIEPVSLVEEVSRLREAGLEADLRISELAHVIFPYHVEQDGAEEAWRGTGIATSAATGFTHGTGRLGTTNRGVGPCREDKAGRIGLRMVDLLDEDLLRARLSRLVPLKRSLLERVLGRPGGRPPVADEVDRLVEEYGAAGRALEPSLCDVSRLLREIRSEGHHIVYEGAQSFGLDLEHGTYPYVTSGYSGACGVTVGTGTSPAQDFTVLGVAKAYMVQVGGGPLMAELDGATADHLVTRGREWGTVTGRRRRVGWFDVPMARRAIEVDGVRRLCLTNLDVLAGLEEVMVVTGYRIGGRAVDSFPVRLGEIASATPVLERLEGWPEQDWREVARRGPEGLPAAAGRYVARLSSLLGVEIVAAGVGPERTDTVFFSGSSLLPPPPPPPSPGHAVALRAEEGPRGGG